MPRHRIHVGRSDIASPMTSLPLEVPVELVSILSAIFLQPRGCTGCNSLAPPKTTPKRAMLYVPRLLDHNPHIKLCVLDRYERTHAARMCTNS